MARAEKANPKESRQGWTSGQVIEPKTCT